MRASKRDARCGGRVTVCLGMITALALALIPPSAHQAVAQGNSRTISGHRVEGRFLAEWDKQGSEQADVYLNGLPLTDAHDEISLSDGKIYKTQWFERARYEAHPENKAPYDLLLGLLGVTLTEGRGIVDPNTGKVRNAADQPFVAVGKPSDPGIAWFQETGHTLSGKIRQYWERYGGLKQFGFPLSEQFEELSATDGMTYTVQYFERNRFELHPEKQAPYDVELGLLGTQQYMAQPIAAAALPIAPPKGVTSSKDTLIVAADQEPNSLMGLEEGTATATRHLQMITFNDSLVYEDDKGVPFPLAPWYVPTFENGGAYFVGTGGDRHLIVKYKLRPGIKWADGVELTSRDAIFSYRLGVEDTNIDQTPWLKLSGIDNPDKYTVLYSYMSNNEIRARYNDPKTDKNAYNWAKAFRKTGKPVSDPGYYKIGKVHPEHLLGNVARTKLKETAYANSPLGYGPYRVDHWTRGVEMLLVQNENYNLTAKPLIKKILIKESVSLDSAYQQIKSGDIDAIFSESIFAPPPQADDLKANGVTVDGVPSASWEFIGMNFYYPPWVDRNVREALIRGIDRQRIVDVVFKGSTNVTNGVVPAVVKTSLENPDYARNFPDLAAKYRLPIYRYDPLGANKLLDDSGWLKGSDGIRGRPGQKLSFQYDTTNNAVRIAVQALVQDDLRKLGIDAVLKQYPTGEFFAPQGPLYRGTCKLCQFAYTQTATSDFSPWEYIICSACDFNTGPNWSQYQNQKVTEANHIVQTEIDPKAQAEASAMAQVQLMTDIAVIPLFQRLNVEIYRNNLAGRKVANTPVAQTWNVTQWYFR
jgi:peptide/nickel transport system substrate-binding protein